MKIKFTASLLPLSPLIRLWTWSKCSHCEFEFSVKYYDEFVKRLCVIFPDNAETISKYELLDSKISSINLGSECSINLESLNNDFSLSKLNSFNIFFILEDLTEGLFKRVLKGIIDS